MKVTKSYIKQLVKEELSRVLKEEEEEEYEEMIIDLKDYLEQVRRGIQLDVERRPWAEVDRSEESAAINFYLQPENLEKIVSGEKIDLGKWHRLLSHWNTGGIYNAGLREMPGFNIMDGYVKSIGVQAKAAVAYK